MNDIFPVLHITFAQLHEVVKVVTQPYSNSKCNIKDMLNLSLINSVLLLSMCHYVAATT